VLRLTRSRFCFATILSCGALLTPAQVALTQPAQNPDFSVTVNTGPTPPNSDTVYPGELTSLRITLSNNSTLASIDNAAFSKALPASAIGGLLIAGGGSVSGAGCTGGVLSTVDGQPGVTLSGLTIPPRTDGVAGSGECYIDLPVTAWSANGAAASHSYSLVAGEVSSDSGSNSSGGPQAITVRPVNRPTWSKSFSGAPLVLGGDPGLLTIQINNPDNNVALTDFSFSDVFPRAGTDGAIFEPTGAAATGSCVAAPVNASAVLQQGASAQVAVSSGTLPPGGSCTVVVEVRARHTNNDFSLNATNVIDADSFSSREGVRPANDATRQVQVRSPLSVTKSFNESPVASGVASGFTIRLGNSGNTPLPVDRFADNPISAAPHVGQLTVTSVSNSCGGGNALLDAGNGFEVTGFSIPANGNCTLNVGFVGQTPGANTPTTYRNVIPQGAVELDGITNIVSQTRTATVIVADRLRVLKSRSPANAAPGSPVQYSVTIQNYSDVVLPNVTVADQLQNGSSFLLGPEYPVELVPASCGTAGLNGRQTGDDDLLFTIPSIAARASASAPGQCTLRFWAMIDPDASGDTTNQIGACAVRVNGSAADCNATPSNPTDVNHVGAIALAKQFDALETSTKREGMVSRLSLRLSNYSDQALSSVTLSDTFPVDGLGQLRVASPSNAVSNCGGSLVAVPGSTSLDLNGGSVPARDGGSGAAGSCEVQLDVVGPAGTYDNTAVTQAVQNNADGSTTQVQASDDARLIYTGVLTAAKSFNPTSSGQGGRSTARVTLTNSDPVRPLSGVSVTDPLPVGMQVASPSGAYSSCGTGAIISADSGATEVSLQNGVIPAGGTCDLVFDVVVDGSSDWTNTIAPGGIRASGGIINQDPVSATLAYEQPEDPIIAKSITPGLIAPGQVARLSITVTNGNTPLSDVAVSDYFTEGGVANGPLNGMRVASPAAVSTSCRAGVVVAQPGDTSVHLSGAILDASESCQIAVNVTSSTVGTITNHIPLNTLRSAESATNSSTFAESTLSTTSSVNVVKNFEPAVVSPGEVSRLRITFFNALTTPLRDFSIRDDLPAGLLVADEANAYSTCGGAVDLTWPSRTSVVLSGGRLAASVDGNATSCLLEIDVVAEDEGTYTNLISENSLTEEGTPLEHPETEDSLEVRERLVVNKAIDGYTLDENDPVGFTTGDAVRLAGVPAPLTIRIENPTSTALTEVRFTDTLPDGMVVAQQPNVQTDCADATVTSPAAAREIRMTGASLAARGDTGAICSVTVNVVSNQHGVYVNQIDEGDVTSFEGVSNEEPTQARLVISEPPSVSKSFEPPVARPNGVSRLSIFIANPNDAATSLTADLIDALPSLPAQMVVATPANIATSCPGGNSIVQAAPGSAQVVVSSGAEVPPVGCNISVDVSAPLAGTYANRIPAHALETTFGVNEDPAGSDLLVSTEGYISGKVFIDLQTTPDGNYVPGEAEAVEGNPIELHQSSSCNDPNPVTINTDAQGNYLFTGLPSGTYSVCQPVQPPASFNSYTREGTIDSVNGSGGTPGTGSNPGSGGYTSQITGIVLNDSGDSDEVSGSPGNNFSEVPPASISGHVYHDSNNNGIREAGESAIAGVEVTLTGPITATVLTDSQGRYSFEGLPPGEYTVTETHPSGWDDGLDSAGTHGGSVENDRITSIVLVAGDRADNYDFGEINPAPPAPLAWTAAAVCVNDAPTVQYQATGATGGTVALFWITEGGRLAERSENLPASGSWLWPGVTVNSAGEPVSWPGWILDDGELVEVPDDRIPTITLRLNGNANTGIVLDYPVCPSQPGRVVQAVPTTPQWILWLLASLLTGVTGVWMRKRPLLT
tara:strand:+ start:10349 stop:15865 length:5517 start_codon:yes stop_codon:yes gene_type:complete